MWFASFTIFSVHKESFHFINSLKFSTIHVHFKKTQPCRITLVKLL